MNRTDSIKKKCSIILSDGTILDNLETDDLYYMASYGIDKSIFIGNCSPMHVLIDNEKEQLHEHAELAVFKKLENGVAFRFRDLSKNEITQKRMEANLEYMAMMLDIDLEE